MALLRIKAKEKIYIVWGSTNAYFIRDVNTLKDGVVTYSNAIGKSFTAGLLLYSTGTVGMVGYLAVRSKDNTTLNGSGNFAITIEHYPTSTEGNKVVNFNVDESPISLNLFYNSLPNISNVIVETDNRTPYAFQLDDFTDHYTDFDSNSMVEIQINGDTSGFTLNGIPLVSGMWIPISYIISEQLIYTPDDTSEYYEKDVTWKAKDSEGNISIT